MLTRIPNTKPGGSTQNRIASHTESCQTKQNEKTRPLSPIQRGKIIGFNGKNRSESWENIPLNLPSDIETALLDRQLKKRPETPDEKALYAIGKELNTHGYPVILRLHRGSIPRLFVGEKVQVTLKWEIEAYLHDEQPETYEEDEYYFDEACLEIWVCGVCTESTLCFSNFLAKMNELKTLNPTLFLGAKCDVIETTFKK